MDKRDYIAQVDDLRCPQALRERIGALPGQVRRPRRHWLPLCACAAVVLIGAGGFLLLQNGGLGGSSAGGGHEEGSSVFLSYAGPVFPLTVLDGAELSAGREITLDFSLWDRTWISNQEEAASRTELTEAGRRQVLDDYNEWFPDGGRYESSTDLLVHDAYVLTNSTQQAQTVTLLYPFVGQLQHLSAQTPTLTVDGVPAEATLRSGGYSGGFQGALGADLITAETAGSLNLDQLDSWEDYKALLSDGSYLAQALGDGPDLSGIPVTVYRFTDPWGPEANEDVPNPSIRATFALDYEQTTVLSYGFHSGRFDRENGVMGQGFSIREPGEAGYGTPCYLIILGEDISGLTTQGYVTGGWDTEETVEAGVTVSRYETDLDTVLRETAQLMYRERQERLEGGDFELYYGLLRDFLASYGALSDAPAERYDAGWLEELDVESADRVFYLEVPLTIPPGETVTAEASFRKAGSFDYYCAHTENQGVYGYDLVTQLGSALTFSSQSARLCGARSVEIVRQNFGFDLEHGIDQVVLDPEAEHYYLEVRRAPS